VAPFQVHQVEIESCERFRSSKALVSFASLLGMQISQDTRYHNETDRFPGVVPECEGGTKVSENKIGSFI
jgi:hypothetical protein